MGRFHPRLSGGRDAANAMNGKNTSRKNSILIAAGVALALAAWMLSGLLGNGSTAPQMRPAVDSASGSADERRMRVTVTHSTAMQIPREIVVSSRTEPNRQVELKAETSGTVVAIGAARGSRVTAGDEIVRIDMRDRRAQLAEAEALVEQRRLEHEAAQRLRGQNFVSEAQIAEAKARLVAAEAARERIALDIGRTSVKAPFEGLLQERLVEIGDYVASGDSIAYIVDTNPMIVVGEINERQVSSLAVGSPGRARLVDGSVIDGTIRYLAPVAADETRTFRVELAVANPEGRIRAGVTAEMRLAGEIITAHSLTPALLALGDDGAIGVKAVDEFNRVRFYPVELVGSSLQGALVTGLPANLRVISVGQGFVTEGQEVIPVEGAAELSQSEDERAY